MNIYLARSGEYYEYIKTKKEIFKMATFSSKQEKRQVFSDPISVLVSVVLIGALVILGPLNASLYNSINGALGTLNSADGVYSADASFASDEQYWDASCSHGWDADSTCDDILLRVQSCVVTIASPYCSNYENYMQQFFNQ